MLLFTRFPLTADLRGRMRRTQGLLGAVRSILHVRLGQTFTSPWVIWHLDLGGVLRGPPFLPPGHHQACRGLSFGIWGGFMESKPRGIAFRWGIWVMGNQFPLRSFEL